VKRSLQVEGHGRPTSAVVAAANVPDDRLLVATIEAMVLERPEPEPDWEQHLALDAGFDTPTGWEACIDHDYSPHIAPRRPEDRPPPAGPRHPPRRWLVERAHSWLTSWRGILVRWEKKPENYLGLIQLACALLWGRHYLRLAPWLRA
jgi:putative transposase